MCSVLLHVCTSWVILAYPHCVIVNNNIIWVRKPSTRCSFLGGLWTHSFPDEWFGTFTAFPNTHHFILKLILSFILRIPMAACLNRIYPSLRGTSLEKRNKCKVCGMLRLGSCKWRTFRRPIHGNLFVNWFAFSLKEWECRSRAARSFYLVRVSKCSLRAP